MWWCRHAVHGTWHKTGTEIHAAGVREPLLWCPRMIGMSHRDCSRSSRHMRRVRWWRSRSRAAVIVIISKSEKFMNSKRRPLMRRCRRLGTRSWNGEMRVVRKGSPRSTTPVGVPMQQIHYRHHQVTVRLIAVWTTGSWITKFPSVLQSSPRKTSDEVSCPIAGLSSSKMKCYWTYQKYKKEILLTIMS